MKSLSLSTYSLRIVSVFTRVKVVVMPLVPGHYVMLQRNLLYTAITRAKNLVILEGTKPSLITAVENDRTRMRYSLLTERLCEEL